MTTLIFAGVFGIPAGVILCWLLDASECGCFEE